MIRIRHLFAALLPVLSCACSHPTGPTPPPPPPVTETRIIALSGSLAFGTVAVGSSGTATLTIANSGTAVMNVTDIAFPTAFSGDFSSGSIPAGGSRSVKVTFTPMAATSYGGTVTVSANQTAGSNTMSATGIGASSGCSVTIPGGDSVPEFAGRVDGSAAKTLIQVQAAVGCPWSASSSVDWLSPAPASGSGSGSITVTVGINPTTAKRSGEVRIGDKTVRFSQAGSPDSGPGPAPKNSAPIVGGALTSAKAPGTYFEWQMTATDPDGDDVTWSVAAGHTCGFLQIIRQDKSGALAGGTAPASFTGSCAIKFQACDRLSACGAWNGTYSWNTAPPPSANSAPIVGGPLTSAAPPGTYFEWQMSATDYDGDEITWSAAPGHTCTFLQVIRQEYKSQSKATAGGTAPAIFTGTCAIKFQACDRFAACGNWTGSYTWNAAPPPPPPSTSTPSLIRTKTVHFLEGGSARDDIEADGLDGKYWGVAGSFIVRWDSTTTSNGFRTANTSFEITNRTQCTMKFDGDYLSPSGFPIKFIGTFDVAPGQTIKLVDHVPIGSYNALDFKTLGGYFVCR